MNLWSPEETKLDNGPSDLSQILWSGWLDSHCATEYSQMVRPGESGSESGSRFLSNLAWIQWKVAEHWRKILIREQPPGAEPGC